MQMLGGKEVVCPNEPQLAAVIYPLQIACPQNLMLP
jgi:hypothetical protein